MTWSPSEGMDEAVRDWMKSKGWEVTKVNYDFDREIYAWRHELRSGPSPTLRISRGVLEDYPPFAVLEHLDRLDVAAALRRSPNIRFAVVQNGTTVTLEEATSSQP
jgi:hypothetical protein